MMNSSIMYPRRGHFLNKIMSVFTSLSTYLKGANEELRKVVWPSKQETIRSTIAVILVSLGMALFFWVLDIIYSYLLSAIITK